MKLFWCKCAGLVRVVRAESEQAAVEVLKPFVFEDEIDTAKACGDFFELVTDGPQEVVISE